MELLLDLSPIFITLASIFLIKKVIPSLGMGIVVAAFIYSDANLGATMQAIWESFIYIFIDINENGTVVMNEWNVPILAFLLLIGAFASIARHIGASKAFANKMSKKIKTRRGAQLVTAAFGTGIFFDDYFNALIVGEINKPITDKYKVSAAELSYIIDSTSAPMAGLMPISTWGAYLVGLIAAGLGGITAFTATEVLVKAIPMQIYSIVALVSVYIVIYFNIKIGKMKKFEKWAMNGNDRSSLKPRELKNREFEEIKLKRDSSIRTIVIPIIALITTTLFTMFYDANFDITELLSQDMTFGLMYGGFVATAIAVIFALRQNVKKDHLKAMIFSGFDSMKETIITLILAWMLASNIGNLEVGTQIGEAISEAVNAGKFHAGFVPAIIFITAGFMAFATGSSWGTFAIMLPIAMPVAFSIEGNDVTPMLLAVIGASISGAILGDHSSPISDTTLMSASGAKCKLKDHFETQLPYALIVGVISLIGYLVFGFTELYSITYIVLTGTIVGAVLGFKHFNRNKN